MLLLTGSGSYIFVGSNERIKKYTIGHFIAFKLIKKILIFFYIFFCEPSEIVFPLKHEHFLSVGRHLEEYTFPDLAKMDRG